MSPSLFLAETRLSFPDSSFSPSPSLSSLSVWAVYKEGVYDLTDYFTTVTFYAADTTVADTYSFLDSSITDVFQNFPGQDITKALDNAFAALGDESASQQLTCLKNAFYKGEKDFRTSPRCTANNYILLAFSVLIMVTILAKCESSSFPLILRFGLFLH